MSLSAKQGVPLRGRLAVAAGVATIAVMVTVSGCSDKTTTTTSVGGTTVPGVTTPITGLQKPSGSTPSITIDPSKIQTPSTDTSMVQTVPVGGKTKEEYEKSLPALEETAKSKPNDLAALQELAIAQYQTAKYADAIATYKQMIAIKDDPTYHNNLANVLRDSGDVSGAIKEYQTALAGNPSLTVAYINLAAVEFAQNQANAAYKTLDEGISKTTGEDQKRLKDIKAEYQKSKTATT